MKPGGLSAFLAMGGYGFYVWTSYLVVVIAVVVEIIAVRVRLRTAARTASGSDHPTLLHDDTQ